MVLTLCVSFLALSSTQAQDYSSAVGLRLGRPVSATYKMFINDSGHAIEGIVGFRSYSGSSSINVGAAYQLHNDLSSVADGLYWYYGGGASIYLWSFDNDIVGVDQTNLTIGIQGYLGLDYKFSGTPVNISLDWTPGFILTNGGGFGGDSGALAVRYVLN